MKQQSSLGKYITVATAEKTLWWSKDQQQERRNIIYTYLFACFTKQVEDEDVYYQPVEMQWQRNDGGVLRGRKDKGVPALISCTQMSSLLEFGIRRGKFFAAQSVFKIDFHTFIWTPALS